MDCPTDDRLNAYLAGQLPAAEASAIARHVDGCDVCLSVVELMGQSPGPPPGQPLRLAAGQSVGRYVLLARLGAGGMGQVWSAYDPDLDRRVALKLVRGAGGNAHLLREAQSLARLGHPNVVAVHDVGSVGDEVFVAMEIVDGSTLAEWLSVPRSSVDVIPVFLQAGEGLAAAHAQGLVHRDFKPGNVMLGRDGRVRVLDFGLARGQTSQMSQMRAMNGATGLAGTPAYMAPEQLAGQPATAASDQFAFAVCLHEALLGQRPWSGASPEALLAAMQTGRPAPRGLPARLERVLTRALAVDPAARFPSMRALLGELGRGSRSARWLVLAAAAIVGAGAAVAAMSGGRSALVPRPQLVLEAAGELDGIWDGAARERVRKAFHGTGRPYAGLAVTATERALDAYAASWILASAPSALGRRCLAERKADLAAVVAELARADASTIDRGPAAVTALVPVAACGDEAALAGREAPPAPVAALADADRRELAAVWALYRSGHLAEARPRAEALLAHARQTGYRPNLAATLVLHADVMLNTSNGDPVASEAELHEAARLALAARDDGAAAAAWIALGKLIGNDPHRTAESREVYGYAQVLVDRLPGRSDLVTDLAVARCTSNATRVAEVVADCKAALTVVRGLSPPQPRKEALVLMFLGHKGGVAGDQDEALANLERSVALFEASAGAEHPLTVQARMSLAILHMSLGHDALAIATLRQVLAARLRVFPEENTEVADARFRLGSALVHGDQAAEAVPLLEAAVAAYAKVLGEDASPTFTAVVALGAAHQLLGHNADAERLYLRAIASQGDRQSEPGLYVPYLQLAEVAPKKRREYLGRALAIFEARGDQRADEVRAQLRR